MEMRQILIEKLRSVGQEGGFTSQTNTELINRFIDVCSDVRYATWKEGLIYKDEFNYKGVAELYAEIQTDELGDLYYLSDEKMHILRTDKGWVMVPTHFVIKPYTVWL